MKRIIWFLFSILILTSTSAQENPYKGDKKLSLVKLVGTPCKAGEPTQKQVVLQVQRFNEQGKLIEFTDYEKESIVELRATFGFPIVIHVASGPAGLYPKD